MILAIFIPLSAYAFDIDTETPFGGEQVMVWDDSTCDCSGTNVHFIMDDTDNSELELYDDGSGKLYGNTQDIDDTGDEQLGTYSDGGDTCEMQVGEFCVDIADPTGTYGTEPGTGLSMLDEKSLLANAFGPIEKTFASKNA